MQQIERTRASGGGGGPGGRGLFAGTGLLVVLVGGGLLLNASLFNGELSSLPIHLVHPIWRHALTTVPSSS